MEFIGKLKNVSKDVITGNWQMTFDVSSVNLEEIDGIKDEEQLKIICKKPHKKRSLDANNYYWLLVGKVADALNISKPHCHNLMLRRYGQIEFFDGQIAYTMLPDTEDTTHRMEQMEESHFAPTSQTTLGKNGVLYRGWRLMKPSHRYNSKEMSILIHGIVDEAKCLGIETMTPAEIRRMMTAWKA